jgi:hypothetical protein
MGPHHPRRARATTPLRILQDGAFLHLARRLSDRGCHARWSSRDLVRRARAMKRSSGQHGHIVHRPVHGPQLTLPKQSGCAPANKVTRLIADLHASQLKRPSLSGKLPISMRTHEVGRVQLRSYDLFTAWSRRPKTAFEERSSASQNGAETTDITRWENSGRLSRGSYEVTSRTSALSETTKPLIAFVMGSDARGSDGWINARNVHG